MIIIRLIIFAHSLENRYFLADSAHRRRHLVVQGDGYDGEDETIAIGRPAKQQNTQQAKPTKGTQVIATCEQNSLIPSVLSFLQSAKEPQGVGGGSGLNVPKNNGSRGNGRI